MPLVIERFYSESVAEHVSSPFGFVPDSRGKHAIQPWECVDDAPLFEGRQHYFRIRRSAEAMSEPCKLLAQPKKVIDLSVKGDDVTAALGVHRLVAGLAKINNREAAMSKANSLIRRNPNSL